MRLTAHGLELRPSVPSKPAGLRWAGELELGMAEKALLRYHGSGMAETGDSLGMVGD